MTADDPEALWAWVHTPTGPRTTSAPGSDCSRSSSSATRGARLCAARVGELRRAALM